MTAQTKTRRPRFKRSDNPPAMHFQPRDGIILQTIYSYDGVLARRHLKDLIWPQASKQAMERRLSLLYHNGYIDWPSKEQRCTKPIPEPVIWLGWRGALYIAGHHSIQIQQPKRVNENQLRLLERHLREGGISWHREPRWIQLHHDLAVVDFKIAIQRSLLALPNLALDKWLSESVFRANMDVVVYTTSGKNGKSRNAKKGVCPDAYFEIVDEIRKAKNEPHRARFLLEMDMATHDNPSFGREKILPGVAYIRCPAYKIRFGQNSGRWLIVSSGKRRMKNLMAQTQEKAGQDALMFFFTTLDGFTSGNVLAAPIWWQVGRDEPTPLIEN